MTNLKEIDNKLYYIINVTKNVDEYNKIWIELKNNKELLKEAVEVVKDKYNERDIVKGLSISECILRHPNLVDKDIYNNLINSIFSNTDIARLMTSNSKDRESFLLLALNNHNLQLTSEQMDFAINEAMNKIGTKFWLNRGEQVSKNLDEKGISDEETIYIDIDGELNPVGKKTAIMYLNEMLSLINNDIHGSGPYDIRYYILRNPNWTIEEKEILVNEFWYDQEMYEDSLETWEWGIINDSAFYNNNLHPLLEKDMLYEYNYDTLLNIYKNKEITDNVVSEIEFCKRMHILRPLILEKEYNTVQKKL